jgi:hypothetical protein
MGCPRGKGVRGSLFIQATYGTLISTSKLNANASREKKNPNKLTEYCSACAVGTWYTNTDQLDGNHARSKKEEKKEMGITLDMARTTSSGGGPSFVQSSGSHLLQIDGYSIAKQATYRTSLKSCPFTVGGYRWMLHLFPDGDGPDRRRSAGFISVFIGLYKDDKQHRVSLQVEFSFIDEVDKQDPAHVRTRQVLEVFPNYGVGYRRFIAREALENSEHLKDHRLTVRCDFIITGFVDLSKKDRGIRKCGACNLRPVTAAYLQLLHACFCDVCNDASRSDPTAKQCAVCHGPYEGRYLRL